MHTHRRLDKRYGTDAANLYILIGVVLILAHKAHTALYIRLLNILNGDILLAIHIDREQIHIAPEDISNVTQLLV